MIFSITPVGAWHSQRGKRDFIASFRLRDPYSNRNSGMDLLDTKAWRQGGIGEVYSFRLLADEQHPPHLIFLPA
jgi:hypothetical protein